MNIVTAEGAPAESIETLKDGRVGLACCWTSPVFAGAPWLEPGESVVRADLEDPATARASGWRRKTSCSSEPATPGD